MLQQQLQRKQKSFALPRGLYILRYETSVDPANPPLVTVICEAGRNEVVLHPDHPLPTLSAPGQSIIIRANETSNVKVEISSTAPLSTLDATLKFEPLRLDVRDEQALPPFQQIASPAASQPVHSGPDWRANESQFPEPPNLSQRSFASGFQIIGHVARLGDVAVPADEWIGGPASPGRIEGILIRWPNKPADIQLRYCAMVAGQRPGEQRVAEVEEFSGTRGRARPLVGFSVEVTGPGAMNYHLTLETLFLGAPVRRATGQSVTSTGPTGREPLVGVRLNIELANAAGDYNVDSAPVANAPHSYNPPVSRFAAAPAHPPVQMMVQAAPQSIASSPPASGPLPSNVISAPTAPAKGVQPAFSGQFSRDNERRRIRVFKS